MQLMQELLDDTKGNLADHILAFFTVFYVDDGYIASRDAKFL